MFTNTHGLMSSPYYPNYYPGRAYCVYIILQPVGTVTVLKFLSMDIEYEYYDYSNNTELDHDFQNGNLTCPFDYLEIKDGSSEQSPLIDKYCGDQTVLSLPMVILTTQNNAWMR